MIHRPLGTPPDRSVRSSAEQPRVHFRNGGGGSHVAVQCLASEPKGLALVARGAMFDAIRERGLALRKSGQETRGSVPVVTDDPKTLPSQMLQDVLLGRSLEVEAVLGQVQAFARERAVAVPAIDVILPLLQSLDRAIRGAE